MSSIESHLSNKPKQVFFNPKNIFDTFSHSITLLYIFNKLFFHLTSNFLIYRPLCIDPQTQANRWIKNMEKNNNLVTCKMSESGGDGLVRNLENAIRVGLPLLIESLGESLDPILNPILTKTIIKKGGEVMMKIGEKIIPYDERFKLYMTTKLPNPHYLPDVCIKVTYVSKIKKV